MKEYDVELTARQFACFVDGALGVLKLMGLGPDDKFDESRLDRVAIRIRQPKFVNGAVDVSVVEYPPPRPAGEPPVLTPGGPGCRGAVSQQKS